jgi:hypothetical protein
MQARPAVQFNMVNINSSHIACRGSATEALVQEPHCSDVILESAPWRKAGERIDGTVPGIGLRYHAFASFSKPRQHKDHHETTDQRKAMGTWNPRYGRVQVGDHGGTRVTLALSQVLPTFS